MTQTLNINTWATEAGRSLSSRIARSAQLIPNQSGLHSEILSLNKELEKNKKRAEQMAQWTKALVIKPDDPSLIPQIPQSKQ